MRIESSVTSVSWIPSEVPTGLLQAGINLGLGHADPPPPEVIEDLEALFAAERFRFANHLAAWIEVTDGVVGDAGYSGRGYISRTRVGGSPHVEWVSPTVWTTLTLTISADGEAAGELTGASRFPRHWVYDQTGQLTAKSAVADLSEWMHVSHGAHTPWGAEDTRPLVAVVETALEHQLSVLIMHGGAKPESRRLPAGALLTEQGAAADDLYLLLDGLIGVSVDGKDSATSGPARSSGSGPSWKGTAHGHRPGRHPLPGRRGRQAPDRPREPGAARGIPSPGGRAR